MKIALAQILSTASPRENLDLMVSTLDEAAEKGAELVVFPEASTQAFGTGRLDTNAQELDSPLIRALDARSRQRGVVTVCGTFRPADTRGSINRIWNTAVVVGLPEREPGNPVYYNKIHTYDAFGYRESDTVKPGGTSVSFTYGGITFGLGICYDVRFPEHFKALARSGVDAFILPTSWADGEGKLEQWRILTSARALDTGSYVIAVGQARPVPQGQEPEHIYGTDSGPTGIGHSALVAPDGRREVEAGYAPEVLYGSIDRAEVEKQRRQLPVLENDSEPYQAS